MSSSAEFLLKPTGDLFFFFLFKPNKILISANGGLGGPSPPHPPPGLGEHVAHRIAPIRAHAAAVDQRQLAGLRGVAPEHGVRHQGTEGVPEMGAEIMEPTGIQKGFQKTNH